MKKVGVPLTPLRTPDMNCSRTRCSWTPAANSLPTRSASGLRGGRRSTPEASGGSSCLPPGFQLLERGENPIGAGIDAERRNVRPAHDPLTVQDEQRAVTDSLALAVDAVGARHVPLGLEVR